MALTDKFFTIMKALLKRAGVRRRVTTNSQRRLLALKGTGGIHPDYDYKRARSGQ